jgi:ferredoxin-NADP reductase
MLCDSVRHMVFGRADGQAFAYIPGQFIQIHFEHEGKALRRSYSAGTLVDPLRLAADEIEIAVSYVEGGAATRLLSAMQPGDRIDASGPYGRFVLNDNDRNGRYLLIATGTGVTPYRAMLPTLRRRIPERGIEVCLLLGARHPEELLYADEFARFADEVPGFRFYACTSRSQPSSPSAHHRAGRVQTALSELAPRAGHDVAYLCGNPEMVDGCFGMLKEAGLPIPDIRREKYVSPPDPKAKVAVAAAE